MPFLLFSPGFLPGAPIPREFTCDGSDISPPLDWNGVASGTASYAIVVEDPDAPGGVFRHWAAWDIGAGNTGIPGGFRQVAPFRQATNDFGKLGYGGPCPPPGSGLHHYHFVLLALSQKSLGLKAPTDAAGMLSAAEPYVIARAELTGTYQR
jgi:hypothetical protein